MRVRPLPRSPPLLNHPRQRSPRRYRSSHRGRPSASRPSTPLQPRTLPSRSDGRRKSTGNAIAMPQELPLPQKENMIAINSGDITLKRVAGGAWQLWMGQKMLRDFGAGDTSENNARDAARVYRDIRPTEWAMIGSPRPVVEYGLINGRPPMAPGMPGAASDDRGRAFPAGGGSGPAHQRRGARRTIIPIDLKTVRVEAIRGVWCLRDDTNILFNFGPNKADAEQAHAVVQRYGFNRIGVVGSPTPVMHYLFATTDAAPAPTPGRSPRPRCRARSMGSAASASPLPASATWGRCSASIRASSTSARTAASGRSFRERK